jgi:predicted site-specific integrase-resolvase
VKLFKAYGVNVIVAFQDEKDYVQELVEHFVEIVKSFAPGIYGQEYEKVVKCVEDVEKDG